MKKILVVTSFLLLTFNLLLAQNQIIDSVLYIAEGTTEIQNWAYRGQNDFTGIEFSSSLTRIGKNAFRETKLKTVIIPEGVETVDIRAFYQCKELEEISFPSTVEAIPYACFTSSEKLSTVIIHEGVLVSGEYAFNNCVSLTELSIPGSVKKINDMAFRNCTGIERLTLTEGIEKIGREAFSSCSNLSEIVIPESVKTIDYMAFSKKTTLIVTAGSEAHKYAVENNYKHEAVGDGELNFDEFILTVDKLLSDSEFLHYANVRTPQSGNKHSVGDKGPGGGTVFYANGPNSSYLEVKLLDGTFDWNAAKTAALNENGGGFSDWRLPTTEELSLIYNEKDNLGIDFGATRYWSLTRDGLKNSPYVWFHDFADGKTYHNSSEGLSALYGAVVVRTVSENLVVEMDGSRYELSPYLGMWNHTDALVVADAYSKLTGEDWSLPTVSQMSAFQKSGVVSEPHNGTYWMNDGNSENSSYFELPSGTYGKSASEKVRHIRLIKSSNASDVSDYVFLNLKTRWNQNGDYRLAFTDDNYMGCGNLAIAQILLYHKLLPKNMLINLSKVENELTDNTPQENKLETSRYIYAVSSKKVVENFDVERKVYEYPSKTTQEEMEQLIVQELSENRPMMIHCYTADKSHDHAMVVDGARYVGDKIQVHLLFGWNGDYDGWFYLWEPINTSMINLDNEYKAIETYMPKKDTETSVNELDTEINIYVIDHTIVVENATDEIYVYDVMGRLVCRNAIHCVRTGITVNNSGVYIVRIGNLVRKVFVE
ncbi:MAG: leucine-rich repeat protein [Bacteroidales bacterium]|nr:leucine-rich repeat protein [Bacteroidales bacterium]